ncbi:hypothetical protein [Paenibacillus arenosi]|uniref:Uncharacterized protein n=1 Tax=Paenibacillus arenosi TaxID=2774142 RepID=A0ABR9AYP8_9BACL|nr:hypothetical protein [Paenibacillus arenosi]MBD8499199.1 hypothetical protein [Paenibacillus arenosi]
MEKGIRTKMLSINILFVLNGIRYVWLYVEIKGVYLDKNTLDPIIESPDDAVLYYAHRPVGYVVYGGKRYE